MSQMLRTRVGAVFKSRRFFSSICSLKLKAKVGQAFKSEKEIESFLSSPTWDINDFLNANDSPRSSQIDEPLVDKLLTLSGLEILGTQEEQAEQVSGIIKSLKEQVKFIDNLHEAPLDDEFISHDGDTEDALSLSQIESLISEQKPDSSKGETEDSWEPLSLATETKNGHFIVREGLVKDK